ncbi:GrpB family protein [Actinomadura parmotrematis]|uniref:GrpB family protein n=1 Tax=Actinomadura parmotrematis TaxID=2864039 RepID=A0ABS7FP17_9ACTN|nr:GrpB family protein [Actinomadura parmotrematis]MBW8482107.1 GrpB family protein [Actinomadura parmotrematis]
MTFPWGEDRVGLHKDVVRVAEPDPLWAEVFAWAARRLRPALDGLAVAVEHVGSTSVPGLPAKPIVDIAVGLSGTATEAAVEAALAPLGYRYLGDAGDDGGWLYVLETRPAFRVLHLHGVRYGDQRWHDYLRFRGVLRRSAAARDAYEHLKRDLAARHAADRPGYTAAKTGFVTRCVRGG